MRQAGVLRDSYYKTLPTLHHVTAENLPTLRASCNSWNSINQSRIESFTCIEFFTLDCSDIISSITMAGSSHPGAPFEYSRRVDLINKIVDGLATLRLNLEQTTRPLWRKPNVRR